MPCEGDGHLESRIVLGILQRIDHHFCGEPSMDDRDVLFPLSELDQ
jgi:hypothetical protein